ncbi:fluoride efflux transporter CrcB [Sandarakinorhabdus oryzae]|uniref:fluoride efflux transporter CrcB n=1 Tax=Sandarakinorhabdus oryzae TaxID=2675220 RepID=UPI0012E1F515|nr:fluoride efflux transporter CrcB [Sandarakinorhabdus oryzae]
MPHLLLVALGGALGSMLRYGVGRWAIVMMGPGFPFGTFAVNILGGLLMGLLAGWLARTSQGGEELRLLLGVGVLGGFTTFSAFSLEVYNMITRAEIALAAAYSVSSVAGSVLAVLAGVWLMRGVA